MHRSQAIHCGMEGSIDEYACGPYQFGLYTTTDSRY